MGDVLIVGDTNTCPELRHEIPVDIMDAFLYAEPDGRRVAIVWSIEGDRIAAVDPSIEIIHVETFPTDDLIRAGVDYYDLTPTNVVRMVESLAIRQARVPRAFPLQHADALRAAGVELIPDQRLFDDRPRHKTPLELEGIRRASRAAEAGMSAIAALLARSEPGDGGRIVDGEPLTCELLRDAAKEAFSEAGCRGDDLIAAHGPQSAEGHSHGSGRVSNDDVLVCDLFPRDLESACYSDMTCTFTVGTPDEEIATWHRQTHDALELARELVRPGANGAEIFRVVCKHYEDLGYPTNVSKPEGMVLREGFNHSLGHGVGLEVHEAPYVGKAGYDLVVVTESGCETITDYPYDLDPAASVVETAR